MAKDTTIQDTKLDKLFRDFVRTVQEMGFGRMAQIVSEEWAKKDPTHGYLKALCPKCDHLFDWK